MMSSWEGAGTLTGKHRLRIAGITLLELLQHKMSRHVAMYFSMVRRSACWASLVNLSTSSSTTTAQGQNSKKVLAYSMASSVVFCQVYHHTYDLNHFSIYSED